MKTSTHSTPGTVQNVGSMKPGSGTRPKLDEIGEWSELAVQNPQKPSRWGQLAREGHQVVQFKDRKTARFVALAVDGVVKEYGAIWRGDSLDR